MELLDGLLDLLFPPKCGVCRLLRREVVCADCLATFRPLRGSVCARCGKPGFDCPTCAPVAYPCRSAFLYEGGAGAAVRRLKYSKVYVLGERMGEILGAFAQETNLFAGVETVIPVPIHTSRFRQRSFNQSELLAAPVARALRADLDCASLVRCRRTPPQVGLRPAERESNVAGAFRVISPERVEGLRLLLIDDVYTSGFTLEECARELVNAGAHSVGALTFCREA